MASHKHCMVLKNVVTLYPRKKRYWLVLRRGSLTYWPFNNDNNDEDETVNNIDGAAGSGAGGHTVAASSHPARRISFDTNPSDFNDSKKKDFFEQKSPSESLSAAPPLCASKESSVSSDGDTLFNITNTSYSNNHHHDHHHNNHHHHHHNINNNNYYNNNSSNNNNNSNSYSSGSHVGNDNSNNDNTVFCINLNDVIGCHCYKGKTPDDSQAYFTVYAYPFRKKILSGRQIRHRLSVTFGIFCQENFQENLRLADVWKKLIGHLARGKPLPGIGGVENIPEEHSRKMLVLINPFSGPGKALKLFQQQVAPMFGEADIHYKKVITDHAGHAHEIVQTLDISRWYAIVIVAGDGLIFEVINGLMSRPDWDQALKIPIGCIPGGSGNALCCSINYSAGEPILENMVLHSTFILIKHQVLPLDLVAIQTINQCIYSFLSVTWGFIADIDYESEKYRRSLGSKRFLILLAQRLIDLRSYRGRLSFIPITAFQDSSDGEGGNVRKLSRFAFDINPGSRSSLNDSDAHIYSDSSGMDEGVTWTSSSTDGACMKRSATLSEGCSVKSKQECSDVRSKNTRHYSETDLSYKESMSCHQDLSFNSCSDITNSPYLIQDSKENTCDHMDHTDTATFQTGNYSNNKAGFSFENTDNIRLKSQQMVTADNIVIQEETLTARKNVGHPVPTPLLPPLLNPLPKNWVVIEDDFVSMTATYQTHLGPDFLSAPDSRFNDGIIHLHFIRTGISRNALLKLFLSVEDGSHLDSPFVESIKVLAFRLEPLDKAGNIMVDGEHIEYGPIQGQVLPGIAKIMGIQ